MTQAQVPSPIPVTRRIFAAAVLFCVFAAPGGAFCPSNGIKCISGGALGFFVGGIGRSHQDITVDAVRELYPDFFPGVKRSTSMDRALEQIYKSNADVDLIQTVSALHFDGENFAGSQMYIASNLDVIKKDLAAGDGNGARAALGNALHTLQDFYAHTNWIEQGHTAPNTSVGRLASLAHVSDTTPTCSLTTTCDSSNITTSGLTSGYWYLDSTPPSSVRKCFHGGIGDHAASSHADGINKDMTNCLISPHEALHRLAADVAKEATKQFLRDLRADITTSQLGLLFGLGPTLAIAIDTTGSMQPIINGVKAQAISIVNSRIGTPDEPSKYVLVPFNDPSSGPAIVTTDPTVFKNAINAISANGGGDCPELAFTGMEQAIAAADDGATLYVFTDASAKDAFKELNVKSLAKKKKIEISMGIFGNCTAAAFAATPHAAMFNGQQSAMFAKSAATLANADSYYARTSAETGGQMFALSSSEAGELTKLADTTLIASATKLLMVSDTFGASPSLFSIPIDPSVGTVTFSVSGAGASGVLVKRPGGATVTTSDSDATLVSLSSGAIWKITSPEKGTWSLAVTGVAGGPFTANVDGSASLRLESLGFVHQDGTDGHLGLFDLSGLPSLGTESMVRATMTEGFADVAFSIRTAGGAVLAALPLATDPNGSPLEFFGTLTPPNGTFLIYATGHDAMGNLFQRVLAVVVAPQAVLVTPPPPSILVRGTTNHYQFQVTNLGVPATFTFTGTDDKGFIAAVAPANASMATNESRTVTVDLAVPAGALAGASETVTLTASNTVTSNFAVVITSVQAIAGPSISSVSPVSGPPAGGSFITISGSNFADSATILIGGLPAVNVVRVSATSITALTPAHATGPADIVVTNPDSQSSTLPQAFSFTQPIPLFSGASLLMVALALALIGQAILRSRT